LAHHGLDSSRVHRGMFLSFTRSNNPEEEEGGLGSTVRHM
jgi:hypothetical protein